MAVIRQKAPGWYWAAAVLLAIWGVIGVVGWWMTLRMSPETMAQMSDYDRHMYATMPAWHLWVYGIGTLSGLAGAIALLLRNGLAVSLYGFSLVFVVILFGWTFLATDLLAVKGASAALFSLVIFVIGVASLWLAVTARRRGWIS